MGETLIRPADKTEAEVISALAMRSKAYWGYSADFMEACREELTWSAERVGSPLVCVAEADGGVLGFYAIERMSPEAFELEALFVEPERIGTGVGRQLIEHAKASARRFGARVLMIQGDPHAEPFYRAAGGRLAGQRPSESIPDRLLPVFEITLK